MLRTRLETLAAAQTNLAELLILPLILISSKTRLLPFITLKLSLLFGGDFDGITLELSLINTHHTPTQFGKIHITVQLSQDLSPPSPY